MSEVETEIIEAIQNLPKRSLSGYHCMLSKRREDGGTINQSELSKEWKSMGESQKSKWNAIHAKNKLLYLYSVAAFHQKYPEASTMSITVPPVSKKRKRRSSKSSSRKKRKN
eukprot:TRINITY_DN12559_c0_g1_i1.p1 TRINITY_DN12559_c0_g1~~TRINITY_DN12559_c0_g1_i1.p1  ORF type:complete len:112 (-),score=29.91 TRINITY_DN12559_c0_g1_i1:38-373(-)